MEWQARNRSILCGVHAPEHLIAGYRDTVCYPKKIYYGYYGRLIPGALLKYFPRYDGSWWIGDWAYGIEFMLIKGLYQQKLPQNLIEKAKPGSCKQARMRASMAIA
jgi:hypothetical protein